MINPKDIENFDKPEVQEQLSPELLAEFEGGKEEGEE